MAKRWLRGVSAPIVGADYFRYARGTMVILYFWFRYLLEYTFVDEVGFSFDGMQEDEGSDGVLTNSDFTFSAVSANFQVGTDEGKYLCIVDPSNEVNSTICEIDTIVSPTQVTVKWYSTDYPTAATGLTWYLFDCTDGSALGINHAFVFDFEHSGGASSTMYVKMLDDNNYDRLQWEFSVGKESWDAVAHDWKGSAVRYTRKISPNEGNVHQGHGTPLMFLYGNTEADICMIMYHGGQGTWSKRAAGWCILNPIFETGHENADKLFIFGMNGGDENNDALRNGNDTYGVDFGEMRYGVKHDDFYWARWCGWYSWLGSGSGMHELFKQSFTAINHRNGSEYDGLPIWVQIDPDFSSPPVWHLIGSIPKDHMWLTNCAGIGEFTVFGSDQYLHFLGGITVPWPGINKSI